MGIRRLRKALSCLIAASLVFTMAPISVFGASMEKGAPNDPFALMYDSDEVAGEQIGAIAESIAMRSVRLAGRAVNDPGKALLEGSAAKLTEDIKEPYLSGNTAKIAKLAISKEDKRRIERIIENAKEDRYIIKYKTENENNRGMAGVKSRTRLKESGNRAELIILNEKVNPKELAETLRAGGISSRIEYIQPDFKMTLKDETVPEEGPPDLEEFSDPEGNEGSEPEPFIEEKEGEGEVPVNDGGNGILVALIDTGVDIFHSGLYGYLADGWNFYPSYYVIQEEMPQIS